MNNLEKQISKLENDINNYDQLKNDQKTFALYNTLKKDLDDCLTLLKTYETTLSDNQEIVVAIPKTEENFNKYLARIEELKEIKNTTLESKIQTYTELNSLTRWCKEYIDNSGQTIRKI